MLKVGLTGGIGSGKSTVAHRLAERGALVIDADRLAREVVEPGTEGLAAVVAEFGAGVLGSDGTLDRAALGRRVFADEQARLRLNAILHPRIATLTVERMSAARAGTVVVHDVPLLVENRMGDGYHLVLVVHADAEERVRRLVAKRGMTEDDARARIAAQADDAARRAAADVWLDNTREVAQVVTTVDRLWDDRLAPYAENLRLGRPAAHPAMRAGAAEDAALAERLRRRLARAVGGSGGPVAVEVDGAPPAAEGLHLVLVAPGALASARERLADAGYFPAPGSPANGTDDGVRYLGADPALAVTVHVRAVSRVRE